MEQTTVNWSDCLEYAKVSDIGMRRANNQDACVVMLASDLAHRAAEVREDATASYTHRVTLQCPQEIVLRALNHPVLMGELWRASGYTPVYQITALDNPTDT